MSTDSRDTDLDWTKVAESHPYWGVISDEQFRGGSLPEQALAEFMRSGELYVDSLLALIRARLDPTFQPRRVLDFGCGVGRLVIPFARRAAEVIGVDVAPPMLERCREHAKQFGLSNVWLHLGSESLTELGGGFDLVNTYIVLQHIPVARGYQLIRALARSLNPGGVGCIHVTYAKARKFQVHELPKARYYRREGHVLIELLEDAMPAPPGTITMYDYDLNTVMAEISQFTKLPFVMVHSDHDGHLGVQIIFVRSPDNA